MRKQVSKSPALLAASPCLAVLCLAVVSVVFVAPRAIAQDATTTATTPAEPGTPAALPPLPADKYLWLEDTDSPRAMDWVKAEDARSLKTLEADPHYAGLLRRGAQDCCRSRSPPRARSARR